MDAPIHGRPQFARSFTSMPRSSKDYSHTFGLLARYYPLSLMEFAGRVLITSACSKHRVLLRIIQPRSYLSCHHCVIAHATVGETFFSTPFIDMNVRPFWLVTCASREITRTELVVFGKKRPDDSGIFVRQCHRRHVRVAPTH